jgi:hypothetical protein
MLHVVGVPPPQVCNCDCLPVVPLELGCSPSCTLGHACASKLPGLQPTDARSLAFEDDELSIDGSSGSLDSSRSEQERLPTTAPRLHGAADVLAAVSPMGGC